MGKSFCLFPYLLFLFDILVTWQIIKSKYELVENGEITVYPAEEKDAEEPEETVEENPEIEDNDGEPAFSAEEKKEGEKVIKDLKYRTYSNGGSKKKRKKSVDDDDEMFPYVIPPEAVGDTGYDLVNLTLYSNGVLVDDLDDEVIEDAELLIGNYAISQQKYCLSKSSWRRKYQLMNLRLRLVE